MSPEETEEWIADQSRVRFPNSEEYCYLVIESVRVAKVLGLATFWFLPDSNLAQLEIIIHPDWRLKGYGIEAIRGLLAYAFTGLRAHRLVAECDARNLTGRRLLLKAGLRQEGEFIQDRLLKGEWVNTVSFALLKQEYETQTRADIPRPKEA